MFLVKMESYLPEGAVLSGVERDSNSGIKFQRRRINVNNTCVHHYVLNSSTDLPKQFKGFFRCSLERSSSFHAHRGYVIWEF